MTGLTPASRLLVHCPLPSGDKVRSPVSLGPDQGHLSRGRGAHGPHEVALAPSLGTATGTPPAREERRGWASPGGLTVPSPGEGAPDCVPRCNLCCALACGPHHLVRVGFATCDIPVSSMPPLAVTWAGSRMAGSRQSGGVTGALPALVPSLLSCHRPLSFPPLGSCTPTLEHTWEGQPAYRKRPGPGTFSSPLTTEPGASWPQHALGWALGPRFKPSATTRGHYTQGSFTGAGAGLWGSCSVSVSPASCLERWSHAGLKPQHPACV